ncbi:hypothetical protein KEM48_012536 [Puccinia striiformis f. sp. tritici PST-130]|nr:hypothetical protein KEM48_012536 [Puccinia striiformis f. sp. tritici PST-130]
MEGNQPTREELVAVDALLEQKRQTAVDYLQTWTLGDPQGEMITLPRLRCLVARDASFREVWNWTMELT